MATRVVPARTEFASAINQVAHERNLDPAVILDTIKQAIVAAFKKDHPASFKEEAAYEVELDGQSGEAIIYEVAEGGRQNVTPPGYGRIATQTAKQVILQKIREAEKEAIIAEYEKRLGTLVNGMVLRFMGNEVVVDIGKAEAVMPPAEQVYSEDYRVNQRLVFYLDSIREGIRGREIVVSRANTSLIKELFRREVPEVNSTAVEIKAIARDPGSRTKIAVYSHQSGVDPVGSCVGQKGVRVQAVIGELNGEKIDIVQYSDDIEKFVTAALSPTTGLKVVVNNKKKVAQVTAPADQLSLAIGRDGQNAKLAGKLTGYHIDIRGDKQPPLTTSTAEKKETTAAADQPTDDTSLLPPPAQPDPSELS